METANARVLARIGPRPSTLRVPEIGNERNASNDSSRTSSIPARPALVGDVAERRRLIGGPGEPRQGAEIGDIAHHPVGIDRGEQGTLGPRDRRKGGERGEVGGHRDTSTSRMGRATQRDATHRRHMIKGDWAYCRAKVSSRTTVAGETEGDSRDTSHPEEGTIYTVTITVRRPYPVEPPGLSVVVAAACGVPSASKARAARV